MVNWDLSNCETQPPASIGWVALSSLIVVRLVGYPASVTPHLDYMMFDTIQTIYFLCGYDPGNSLSTFMCTIQLLLNGNILCAILSRDIKRRHFSIDNENMYWKNKPFSWHPRRPRAHPRSIRVSHKIPSCSCFPNILSEISEKNWNKHV